MFWSFIKANKKGTNTLPSTMSLEGRCYNTSGEISDAFAEYFQSNFLSSSSDRNSSTPSPTNTPTDSALNIGEIEINSNHLLGLLESLDLTKGAGPDNIPPLFIVKCAKGLVRPLMIIFTRSVNEGIVPSLWKYAYITPVHKSGNKSDIINYRPISKLCLFGKILERIIYTQVYSTFSSSFIPQQHGFLKNRSTTTNLLSFVDFTTSSMDDGGQVDCIFTDYSKCFDRIDHNILLQKILDAGIHGNLYRWITSYIKNRSQAVVINGVVSKRHLVPSGVPQGSLLGPLLFNIFINDIYTCFQNSLFLLYADDMKVFKRINNVEDCYSLQQDLERLENYCQLNNLELNVSKCYTITFTRKAVSISHPYTIKNDQLKRVDFIRDLGVMHDSKLTYEKHVEHTVNKANKAMGFLKRSCSQFTDIKIIKILYCSYVRSSLEYCSQVWNPMYAIYVSRLESVQRNFTRYLQYKCKTRDHNYESRCKRYHLLPLRERRTISDISFLVKLAQSCIDAPQLLSKINLRVPTRSARTPFLLLNVPRCHTNYRQNSFFVRCAKSYNNLVDFSELDLFITKPHVFNRILTKQWFELVQ